MTINNMAFTPTDGIKNISSFPTVPADEAAARKQIQDLLDQLRDYLNANVVTGVNTHLTDTTTAHGINLKANKAQPAFASATLGNGWTGTLEYSKNDLNLVTLRFKITSGTVTALTTIATLPFGYLPVYDIPIPILKNSNAGQAGEFLYLDISGRVRTVTGVTLAASTAYTGAIVYYAA